MHVREEQQDINNVIIIPKSNKDAQQVAALAVVEFRKELALSLSVRYKE